MIDPVVLDEIKHDRRETALAVAREMAENEAGPVEDWYADAEYDLAGMSDEECAETLDCWGDRQKGAAYRLLMWLLLDWLHEKYIDAQHQRDGEAVTAMFHRDLADRAEVLRNLAIDELLREKFE